MDVSKLKYGQIKALFFSLRNQYLSDSKMTDAEIKTMWELQGKLWQKHGRFIGMITKIKTK